MVKRLAIFLFLVCFATIAYSDANSGDTLLNSTVNNPVNELSKVSPELIWDFGKVKAGDVVKHDFVIKNDSTSILRVKEVTTSCGCTVSRIKKMIVKPGESTIIEVKFNSKGYNGKIKQFIYVTTDSLDKPLVRYIIEAEVIAAKAPNPDA